MSFISRLLSRSVVWHLLCTRFYVHNTTWPFLVFCIDPSHAGNRWQCIVLYTLGSEVTQIHLYYWQLNSTREENTTVLTTICWSVFSYQIRRKKTFFCCIHDIDWWIHGNGALTACVARGRGRCRRAQVDRATATPRGVCGQRGGAAAATSQSVPWLAEPIYCVTRRLVLYEPATPTEQKVGMARGNVYAETGIVDWSGGRGRQEVKPGR